LLAVYCAKVCASVDKTARSNYDYMSVILLCKFSTLKVYGMITFLLQKLVEII